MEPLRRSRIGSVTDPGRLKLRRRGNCFIHSGLREELIGFTVACVCVYFLFLVKNRSKRSDRNFYRLNVIKVYCIATLERFYTYYVGIYPYRFDENKCLVTRVNHRTEKIIRTVSYIQGGLWKTEWRAIPNPCRPRAQRFVAVVSSPIQVLVLLHFGSHAVLTCAQIV